MKRLTSLLLALFMTVLMSATALADEARIFEGADITVVKRLAIAMPMYYPPDSNAPTAADLAQLLYETGSRSSDCYIISYDEIANNIKRDTGVDIKMLSTKKAAKSFAENVGNYADAYIVATVTNGKKMEMFFAVDDAKTFANLYDYNVIGSKIDKPSLLVFRSMCERFYHRFDRSAEKQQKEFDKAAKEKQLTTDTREQKAEKE